MDEEEFYGSINGNFGAHIDNDGSIFNMEQFPKMLTKQPNYYGWSGNFRGFIQYRKTFEGENRSDDRVKIKSYE